MTGWVEPTISLGSIIAAVSVIVTVIGFFWKTFTKLNDMHAENSNRLTTLETKIDPLWRWWTRRIDHRDPDSVDQ